MSIELVMGYSVPGRTECSIFDRQTGHESLFKAPKAVEDADLRIKHPIVRRRIHLARRLVNVHRDWREPLPPRQSLSSSQIVDKLKGDTPWVESELKYYKLEPEMWGLDVVSQLKRLGKGVLLWEKELGHPLRNEEWDAMSGQIGHHAELDSLSEALRVRKALLKDEDMILQFDLKTYIRGKKSLAARCVHCAFVTQGVHPTRRQQVAERAVEKRWPLT